MSATEPAPPAAPTAPTAPGPRRSWLRRLVRWLFVAVALLLAALVIALLTVVYTAWGTRLAVRTGLAWYGGQIAGRIEVGSIEGSLAAGLVVGEIRLVTATGETPVAVARLRAHVELGALLEATVRTEELALEGVRVDLGDDPAAAFADFAPPPSDEPTEPSPGLGPDLPLTLQLELRLHDAQLLTPDVALTIPGFALALEAAGTAARLDFGGALELHEVAALSWLEGTVYWDEPVVALSEIVVQGDLGEAHLTDLWLDLLTQAGALEQLTIVVPRPASLPPGEPLRLELSAAGDAWATTVLASVRADESTTLHASAALALEPRLAASVELELQADPRPWLAPWLEPRAAPPLVTAAEHLELLARATLRPEGQGQVRGHLEAALMLDHDATVRPELVLDGQLGETGSWGELHAHAKLAGVQLDTEAVAVDSGHGIAHAKLESADLSEVSTLLARLGLAVPLRGEARIEVACLGGVSPLAGWCEGETKLDHGHPIAAFESRIALALDGDDAQRVRVQGLRAEARGITLRQRSEALTVARTGPRIEVRRADFELDTGTGKGRVGIEGAMQGETADELRLEVRQLELAALSRVVPGLPLRGTLELDALVSGALDAPVGTLHARARQLRYDGLALGWVTLTVDSDGTAVDVRARGEGPAYGRLDARARARLPDAQGRVQGPVMARVSVTEVALHEVAATFAGNDAIGGRLALEATLDGSSSRPRLAATLALREASHAGRALGDLDLDAGYAAGDAHAQLDWRHEAWDSLSLAAHGAVTLDLARGRARWRPRGPHGVDLDLRALRLAALEPWAPGTGLEGLVDVELDLEGNMIDPVVRALVRAREASWQAHALGELTVAAGYREGLATIMAAGRGPVVTGLGLTAEIPLDWVPATGALRWRAEEPQQAQLAVMGVMLGPLAELAQPPLDVAGRTDLIVDLRGTGLDPRIDAELDLDHGRYGGRDVGQLALQASLEGDTLTTSARWATPQGRTRSTLALVVPLHVDAAAGAVAWRESAEHRIDLELLDVDAAALEPFVELPAKSTLALRGGLHGRGHAREFTLDAAIDGEVSLAATPARSLHVGLEASETQQHAELRLDGDGEGRVTVDVTTGLVVGALLDDQADPWEAPLEATLAVEALALAPLGGLLPRELQGLEGVIEGRASVRGSAAVPTLSGDLELRDAGITVVPLRQRFEGARLVAKLRGDRVEVPRFSLSSGAGTLTGRAEAHLGRAASVHVGLVADQIPLQQPGLPQLRIDSTIAIDLLRDETATRVDVDLSGTKVDVISTIIANPAPIAENPRVRVVDDLDAPRERPLPSRPAADERPLMVKLALSEPLRIRGPAVDMSWHGAMQAETSAAGVDAQGALATDEGFFELLGNRFTLQPSELRIIESDGLVPFLDLEARSEIGDVSVTATIRGPLPRPSLTLRSDPQLPESDIFALLVTGNADGAAADPAQVQAQAASVLAALSNPALQRQLNERLRVDRIGVQFGETTEQPILSVGKNLGKKTYAETIYHHNAPTTANSAELRVRYRFAPRWSLESFFGDAAVAGFDVFWGRGFDGRLRAADPPEGDAAR